MAQVAVKPLSTLKREKQKLEEALVRQDEVIGRAMERRVGLEEELAAVLEALDRAAR